MSRLTVSIREDMASALVRHRFDERAQLLISETRSLFKRLYEQHYDPATRAQMVLIDRKYQGAFRRDDDMYANVSGRRIQVGKRRIGASDVAWTYDVENRMFARDIPSNGVGLSLDDPLAIEIVKFDDVCEALRQEIPEAYRKALGALSQFSTGKKLAADWPEAMNIIGHLIPEDDRTVPVVQVALLNKDFGLPVTQP